MMAKTGLCLIKPTSAISTGWAGVGNYLEITPNGSVQFWSSYGIWLTGVFSPEFDNYMIVWRCKEATSVNGQVAFQLLSGNTVESTALSYVSQEMSASSTTLIGSRVSADYGWFTAGSNTIENGSIAYIYGPYMEQPTAWRTVSTQGASSASIYEIAGTHALAKSYDGIYISRSTFLYTGRVAVYGMRK